MFDTRPVYLTHIYERHLLGLYAGLWPLTLTS